MREEKKELRKRRLTRGDGNIRKLVTKREEKKKANAKEREKQG